MPLLKSNAIAPRLWRSRGVTAPLPPAAGRLDHADGGVLHMLALFFGHFQLGEVIGSIFIDVEEDVFADGGS